jgi:hypothetical protein
MLTGIFRIVYCLRQGQSIPNQEYLIGRLGFCPQTLYFAYKASTLSVMDIFFFQNIIKHHGNFHLLRMSYNVMEGFSF